MKTTCKLVKAEKGSIFVLTEEGYDFSVKAYPELAEERKVGSPVNRYEFMVPKTWIDEGWVKEVNYKMTVSSPISRCGKIETLIGDDGNWWLHELEHDVYLNTGYNYCHMAEHDVIPRAKQDNKRFEWSVMIIGREVVK